MTFPLTIIAAVDRNGLLGNSNSNALPWHIPADLKFFKEQTMNANIVMGRSTFESIGRPLPNRKNIILTHKKDYTVPPNCIVYNTVSDVLLHAVIEITIPTYIIGGSSVYSQFIPHADTMYITYIDGKFEGDAYFPEYDRSQWKVVHEQFISKGEDTDYNLTIKKYLRIY